MKTKLVAVEKVGLRDVVSPLSLKEDATFISDNGCVIYPVHRDEIRHFEAQDGVVFFELAGPREKIHFSPVGLGCGIVTCGGLCPGINNVIRGIVIELFERYGVRRVLGFRYGYKGLAKSNAFEPIMLTPDKVDNIHEEGGSILGSSRGPQDIREIVDTLIKRNIKILFAIGGDGTMHGISQIVDCIRQKGLNISVIGVPKTIDNDINFIEKSFGFETAVRESKVIIDSAHEEAKGAVNGIGLVKVMGRYSGFIASYAALASGNLNFCFIPERPFRLQGDAAFLEVLKVRLKKKHHALIVVAEGAGQDLIKDDSSEIERDPSGNLKLKDIGEFLKSSIELYFRETDMEVNLKYINPSYTLRSIPADAMDSAYCLFLAQNAVHAGMAGRTAVLIGFWNHHYIHVPISMAVKERKIVDTHGRLWKTVMETTLQPYSIFEKA